tara:strand:+ start:21177 stop:21401 length:225 start_codon:yes stop_codon:yes gene_type:complete
MQKEVIMKLSTSNDNFNLIIKNLNKIIANKDDEIVLKDETILIQKKEIRKQKFYKSVAVVGAIVLPILLLFLTN